ncbi:MAG: hypothetical protein U0840_28560 [Gemmataceae bacterium]
MPPTFTGWAGCQGHLPLGNGWSRFGKLGREYKQLVFDKELLKKEISAEWVTPGHLLFEVVREDALERAGDDLRRGQAFTICTHGLRTCSTCSPPP